MVVKGRHFSYQKNVGQTGLTCLSEADLRIPTVQRYRGWPMVPPPQKINPTKPCPVSKRTRTNDLSQTHSFLSLPFLDNIQAKTDANNIRGNFAGREATEPEKSRKNRNKRLLFRVLLVGDKDSVKKHSCYKTCLWACIYAQVYAHIFSW